MRAISSGIKPYFYPRPPWGGRHFGAPGPLQHQGISIHALRGEGDGPSSSMALHTGIFLSTPSVGRATSTSHGAMWPQTFLSTPSVGRATLWVVMSPSLTAYFYPRPPWGGRRVVIDAFGKPRHISIHALRGEGDVGDGRRFHRQEISIHALRGEGDAPVVPHRLTVLISIHALRGEGDLPAPGRPRPRR